MYDPNLKLASCGAHAGRYVLLSTLGESGMGLVYEAYDPELARTVLRTGVGFNHATHIRTLRAPDLRCSA